MLRPREESPKPRPSEGEDTLAEIAFRNHASPSKPPLFPRRKSLDKVAEHETPTLSRSGSSGSLDSMNPVAPIVPPPSRLPTPPLKPGSLPPSREASPSIKKPPSRSMEPTSPHRAVKPLLNPRSTSDEPGAKGLATVTVRRGSMGTPDVKACMTERRSSISSQGRVELVTEDWVFIPEEKKPEDTPVAFHLASSPLASPPMNRGGSDTSGGESRSVSPKLPLGRSVSEGSDSGGDATRGTTSARGRNSKVPLPRHTSPRADLAKKAVPLLPRVSPGIKPKESPDKRTETQADLRIKVEPEKKYDDEHGHTMVHLRNAESEQETRRMRHFTFGGRNTPTDSLPPDSREPRVFRPESRSLPPEPRSLPPEPRAVPLESRSMPPGPLQAGSIASGSLPPEARPLPVPIESRSLPSGHLHPESRSLPPEPRNAHSSKQWRSMASPPSQAILVELGTDSLEPNPRTGEEILDKARQEREKTRQSAERVRKNHLDKPRSVGPRGPTERAAHTLLESASLPPMRPSPVKDVSPLSRGSREPQPPPKPPPRVLVSIPDSLIAKVHGALEEAGAEGLSCTQLLNHPKCKRLKFPCTLQGASPGAILRALNCVRYENKRYYYDPNARPTAPVSSTSGYLRYSREELVALKFSSAPDLSFQETVRERLRDVGLAGESEIVSDWADRLVRRLAPRSYASPALFFGPPSLTHSPSPDGSKSPNSTPFSSFSPQASSAILASGASATI